MDEDNRTIFCGNLSNRVTEDILYELFLQAGPVERVNIPKDRDGKQRTFGFITYKHVNSVKYALDLFVGTILYDRTVTMNPKNNTESQVTFNNSKDQYMRNMMQQVLQQQTPPLIGLGNLPLLGMNSNNGDRDLKRMHPYQRDRDRYREREKIRDRDRNRDRDRERNKERNNHNDYYRDERPHYNRDNNHRSNDYSRYNGNRKRWTYH